MSVVSRYASWAASAALAAAFAAVAFVGKGGNELGRVTTLEVLLIVGGGIAAAIGVAYGRTGHHGRGSLLLFGLLAALTAISIFWSIAPDLTWIESDRTFAYFAVFAAGGAVCRLPPGGAARLVRAGLGARGGLTPLPPPARVRPRQLGGPAEIFARLPQPC